MQSNTHPSQQQSIHGFLILHVHIMFHMKVSGPYMVVL